MNLLDLTPRRAAGWEQRESRVVLVRRRPSSRGPRSVISWLSYLLAPRKFRLDELGSFCWRQIDGSRTAWDIAESLRREYGNSSEPAEERVGRFLRFLQREELVHFLELEVSPPSESGGPQ